MNKRHIAIDASGDAGILNSDTDQLVVAAVITESDESKNKLYEAIDLFRLRLGWIDKHEFKFSKTEKCIIINLINFINDFEYTAYVVVLDKTKIDLENLPIKKTPIYNQVMKDLLLKVSDNNSLITIDGKTGRQYDKQVRVYLRKSLRENGIMNSRIRFVDSREDSLIQLADIIAGAVARTYKNKTDSQKYIKLLAKKIISIDEIIL